MHTNPKKLEKLFQIARLTSTNVYEKRGAKNLLRTAPLKFTGTSLPASNRIEA